MKKSKDQKKFREGIKKGEKIVTIGGIHGKIAEIKDATVLIDVEGGNRLKIEKSAISLESSAALNK
jgi:preprotein translocase subunit YajC